jgi:hypothetical protein
MQWKINRLTKYTKLGIIHPRKVKLKELANLNNGNNVSPNWFPLPSEAGSTLESISAVNKYPITCSLPIRDTKRDTDGAIMAKPNRIAEVYPREITVK